MQVPQESIEAISEDSFDKLLLRVVVVVVVVVAAVAAVGAVVVVVVVEFSDGQDAQLAAVMHSLAATIPAQDFQCMVFPYMGMHDEPWFLCRKWNWVRATG